MFAGRKTNLGKYGVKRAIIIIIATNIMALQYFSAFLPNTRNKRIKSSVRHGNHCFHPSSFHVSHIRAMHNHTCFRGCHFLCMLNISLHSALMLITNAALFFLTVAHVQYTHVLKRVNGGCVWQIYWSLYEMLCREKVHRADTQVVGNTDTHISPGLSCCRDRNLAATTQGMYISPGVCL